MFGHSLFRNHEGTRLPHELLTFFLYFLTYRPGHFARLLSSHYGSKVKIIGLDANEHVLTTAKELSDGLVEGSVTYVQGDFNKYSDDVPYDVIVFTKSFHHCLPIDEVLTVLNGVSSVVLS
jgi:ubiquinone/menaquinone biosynthesis C-methylase UbiE